MFWFLHYAVKVGIGLALVGLGLVLYLNRQWFQPADEWAQTLRRTRTDTLPVVGQATGRVVRASSGDTLVVRVENGGPIAWRIAGILGPPASKQPRSARAMAFQASRDALLRLARSNEVSVSYTFVAPEGGGIGGVYLAGTNLAIPLVSEGMVIVHDASLKSLPLVEQVQLLAAEKEAREARRGLWSDTVQLSTPGP
jgi:endonuclease YncB( thermonuclease family)